MRYAESEAGWRRGCHNLGLNLDPETVSGSVGVRNFRVRVRVKTVLELGLGLGLRLDRLGYALGFGYGADLAHYYLWSKQSLKIVSHLRMRVRVK